MFKKQLAFKSAVVKNSPISCAAPAPMLVTLKEFRFSIITSKKFQIKQVRISVCACRLQSGVNL